MLLPLAWQASVAPLPPLPPTDVGITPLFDGAGGVYALDYSSPGGLAARFAAASGGAPVWVASLGTSAAPDNNGGMCLALGGELLVAVNGDGVVPAFHAATGVSAWTINFVNNASVISKPAALGNLLVVKLDDGTARAFSMTLRGATEAWRVDLGGYDPDAVLGNRASATFDGTGTVFVYATLPEGGTRVFAVATASGATLWDKQFGLQKSPGTELVFAAGRLVFGCLGAGGGSGGGVGALNASNGELLWFRSPSGETSNGVVSGTPAYSATLGLIFVTQLFSGVFAVRLEDGRNEWFSPDGFSYVSIAVDGGGILYVVNVLGVLGAFSATNGSLLASVEADNAASASSPAIDGAGRLALYSSTSAKLLVFGPGGGAGAGAGGGLPPAAVAGAVVLAAAVALGGAVVCARALRRGGKPVAPQRAMRSAATSMAEPGSGEEALFSRRSPQLQLQLQQPLLSRGGGGTTATAVSTVSATQLTLQRQPQQGPPSLPGEEEEGSVVCFTEASTADADGMGSVEAVEGHQVGAVAGSLVSMRALAGGDSFVMRYS